MASGFLTPSFNQAGEQKEPALLHPPVRFCTYHTAKEKQNMEVNGRTQAQEGTSYRHKVPLQVLSLNQ